jgi:hypothetical protein
LVFIKKKVTKTGFLKKTETSSNRPVSVRFGYFGEKTGSNHFGSVFSVSGLQNQTEPIDFFKILIGFFFHGSIFQFFFPVFSVF